MNLLRLAAVFFLIQMQAACDRTTAVEHLARAENHALASDYRAAVIELQNALRKDPDFMEARAALGEAHLALGDFATSVKEFERTIALGSQEESVRAGLLAGKLGLGEHQAVLDELDGEADLSPSLKVLLADAHLQAGQFDLAAALYSQTADLAGAQLGLGTIAWVQGDVESAAYHLARTIELDPSLRDAWIRKGEFELTQRQFTAAAEAFRALLDLPGGELTGRLGVSRASLLVGDLDGASEHIGLFLSQASGFPGGHYLDALIRYQKGDLDGAESALREVQKTQPDHEPSLLLMGAVKFQQGQLGQAEGNLRRYLARNRSSETAAKILAAVLRQQGDLEEVVTVLIPHREGTVDPQILAMLGTALMLLGDIQQAVATLEQAVWLAPDSATFRNQLTLGLLSAVDDSQAPVVLASALAVDTEQYQSDYLAALLSLKDGDPVAAIDAANIMALEDESNPVGSFLKGVAYLAQEQEAPAAEAFETALEVAPDFFPAVTHLARMAERRGDLQKAISLYEGYLRTQPTHVEARLAKAAMLLRLGELADARRELETLISQKPDLLRPRVELGRLYLRENRLDEAAGQLDAALRINPDAAQALLLSTEVALRQRADFVAQQHLESLQLLLDEWPDSKALHLAVGALQVRVTQLQLARRNLNRALALTDPEDQAFHQEVLRELVRLNLAAGEVELARARFEELVQNGDESIQLLEADLLLAEDRHPEAIEAYQALVSRGNREAVLRLSIAQLDHGDVDAAIAVMEVWLADHPADLGVAMLRAAGLARKGDVDGTIAQYEALKGTEDPVVLNNLAWLYMERGDERAIATAEQAYALAPDDPDIADTMGWILVQFGQPVSAIQLINSSVRARPSDATFHYHLGVAYLEAGDLEAGRAALEEAMKLGDFPDRPEVERRLQALSVPVPASS